MKVTLFAAVSSNGMIARKSGEEDFLSDENWKTFCETANRKGCVIWGRRTHDALKKWEKRYLKKIKEVTKVVLSSEIIRDENIVTAKTPREALEILKKKGFNEALLAGGSETNSSFANANLVDEIIINIEPVVVSKGIPLFSDKDFELDLHLLEANNISKTTVRLHYRVKKQHV